MDEQTIDTRLLANPDDDELAVLADALQVLGDPRGELIALELAGRPFTLAYGLSFHRGWYELEFSYSAHYLLEWTQVAPWIRTIRVHAAAELLERFLEDMCAQCTNLETLSLQINGPFTPTEACESIQWALDVSPRLRTFELHCDRSQIRPLDHRTLRCLRARDSTAARVLLRSAAEYPPVSESRWPMVTELVVDDLHHGDRLELLHLPALRVLDFSNADSDRATAITLDNLDGLANLRELRLPARITPSSAERLVRITAALPRVRVVR
ncbi:MAG TPA: hypothetical protein VGC41_00845 [Kofleriaceae bacterium]